MQVADPTPVAKGLLVAAVFLVGIPGVCRWIEDTVAHTHGLPGYPVAGIVLLILIAAMRPAAPPLPAEPPRRPSARPNRLQP